MASAQPGKPAGSTMGGIRPLACAALAGLALLLASCAPPGFREGVERVHQTWLDDNAQVYSTQGSRRVALKPAEAQRAAHSALEQIGLTVTQDDPGTGVVEADRPLITADISGAVRDAELPRVHQIMAEAMGPLGASIPMGMGEGSLLVATATIEGAGTASVVGIRMCNGARDQTGAYIVGRCVIPTAQLRAGLNEFWRAFDQEAAALEALRPSGAGRAQRAPAPAPPGPVRPPSQWVLPD